MIKHIVMYRLKNSTEENKEALVRKFLSMDGKITELKSIEAGADVLGSERSYDVALVCSFDSIKNMAIYRDHPVHLKVKEYVQSVVASSISVDYEY